MDLFGIKEHDERHDETERNLRRLVEQVAQLSIDLGVTRTELRGLSLTVEGKVSEDDVDPALAALNKGIETARVKLAATEEAAEENWAAVNDELSDALDSFHEGWPKALTDRNMSFLTNRPGSVRTRRRVQGYVRFCKRYSAVSLASWGRSSGCHSKPVMNTSVIGSGVDAAAV